MAGLVCIAAGHPDPELVESVTPQGLNTYYQAHPWNGCGLTDVGGAPLSACR